MRRIDLMMTGLLVAAIAGLMVGVLLHRPSPPERVITPDDGAERFMDDWKSDPVWNEGKAEWALYDAQRVIYGKVRRYEATIFTNKQHMDPDTTVKAADWRAEGMFEVFKHTISEIIPADHYDYRFLTTSFIHTDGLLPYKLIASSQEDCGTSYRQFVVDRDDRMHARQFCYFPDAGETFAEYAVPQEFAFFNALSLSLRDFPFGAVFIRAPELNFVPEQRDNMQTILETLHGVISYVGEETLDLPCGRVRAHHVQVDHDEMGGVRTTHYWFASEPAMRNVMVQYEGPFGVKYRLKKYGWWAYWNADEPPPQ